jgi:hypothetical protein
MNKANRDEKKEYIQKKSTMIGTGTDDTHFDAILWIPSSISVKDVDTLAGLQIIDRTLPVDHKSMLIKGNVHRAPPHIILTPGFGNDTLVLGTATSTLTRARGQSTR